MENTSHIRAELAWLIYLCAKGAAKTNLPPRNPYSCGINASPVSEADSSTAVRRGSIWVFCHIFLLGKHW